MSRASVGLTFDDGHVVVTAVHGPRRLEQFRLKPDETLGARLATELDSRGLGRRRMRVGLDRGMAVVKTLDLPLTAGGNLRPMVAFELERHVPFPAQDIRFDCVSLSRKPKAVRRVLVMAAEGRTVDGALRPLDTLRRPPRSVTAACHDLPALLSRRKATGRAVWIHRHGAHTDLLCLTQGVVRLSRRIPSGPDVDLAGEIARTLPLAAWRSCDAIWVSGDDAERIRVALRRESPDVPVTAPPFGRAGARLIDKLPLRHRGAGLLALAVAVGQPRPTLNLVPATTRPVAISGVQRLAAWLAAAAAVLGLGLLLAHGHAQERYLARLTDEIRRLDPEVKTVERLGAEIVEQKRLLAAVRAAEAGGLRPLPVLKELTELIPPDAWLQSVSMDGQGLEITGQAAAASQLIPLLDASPTLERVEFTAPVTKVQDKAQFRIRASWEEPAPSRAGPPGEGEPKP
jgi:general secretion pathway protein L